MAASITIDDQGFEDLFTCSVCFETFNNEGRKPKFLSCYHTLCLECVKAITTQLMVVACPICRKETPLNENDKFELPNNHYILQMMAGSKNSSKPSAQSSSPQPIKEHWCRKCRKESSNLCSLSPGRSINISGCEYCSESRFHELQKIVESNESQLRNIVGKRMEAKNNCNLIYTALKVIEDAVKKLEEDNDLQIVEIVSLLESPITLIGKEANVQSLAKKVADFLELEENFFSYIRDIKMPDHSLNEARLTSGTNAGGQNENQMTFPVASQILFTLIKSDVIKSNEMPVVQRPLIANPNPKPMLNSSNDLSKLPIQTATISYNFTNSPPSMAPVGAPSSRESHQIDGQDSKCNHNSTTASLLESTTSSRSPTHVKQKNQLKPLNPSPIPPRNPLSLSPILIAQCYRKKKFTF